MTVVGSLCLPTPVACVAKTLSVEDGSREEGLACWVGWDAGRTSLTAEVMLAPWFGKNLMLFSGLEGRKTLPGATTYKNGEKT